MKENNWLFPIKKKKSLDKAYVKYTSPLTDYPLQVIEIDIKYMYIHGAERNAYLITLLDTFYRGALAWVLEYNMKAQRAMELIEKFTLKENFDNIPQITIRSDNGSQFIASAFRDLLKKHNINHEYIHPGTPEENGHIESFHNTVGNSVCKKFYLEDIYQAREILERFYDYYNNERIMKSILYQSPSGFLKLWNEGKVGIKRMDKKQIFFFREKPRIAGASLPEDFCILGQSEVKKEFVNCITTS
jgi:putative transposase